MSKGRKQDLERSLMATWALLVMRRRGVRPTPAARAAILAYLTWTDHPNPEAQVDVRKDAVLKALQRLRSGRVNIHPAILDAVCWCNKATGKPVFGRPEEIAESVAQFLDPK